MKNYVASACIGFKFGPCTECQQLVPLSISPMTYEMARITAEADPELYNKYNDSPEIYETILHTFYGQVCKGSGSSPQAVCAD